MFPPAALASLPQITGSVPLTSPTTSYRVRIINVSSRRFFPKKNPLLSQCIFIYIQVLRVYIFIYLHITSSRDRFGIRVSYLSTRFGVFGFPSSQTLFSFHSLILVVGAKFYTTPRSGLTSKSHGLPFGSQLMAARVSFLVKLDLLICTHMAL